MCIAITVAEGASEKVNLRVFVNDVEATYSFQGKTTSPVSFLGLISYILFQYVKRAMIM